MRTVKLPDGHVKDAIENYLRSLSLIDDDEILVNATHDQKNNLVITVKKDKS